MLRTLSYLPVLLVALSSPPRYRVHIQLTGTPSDLALVTNALDRGLFADSAIVRAPQASAVPWSPPLDSAARANTIHAVLVRGNIDGTGDTVVVRLEMFNVLARTVAGPDTIRVARAAVDSAITDRGRAYARKLVKR